MKCRVIVDKSREEEAVLYVHRETERTRELEAFITAEQRELYGYGERDIVRLSLCEVLCFYVRDGKVFAMMEKEDLQMKERLYQVEEMLPMDFVKINQSCIANKKKIRRFEVSIGGSLMVVFQNGKKDYVSRRKLKEVKERMGLI